MKTNDDLIVENLPLVKYLIKKMNLYFKNEMDFENIYDAGVNGLINGARTYKEDKNIKVSTYLGRCITNEINKYLKAQNRLKRCNELGSDISLNITSGNKEIWEFIKSNVNIEKEVETKILVEDITKAIDLIDRDRDKIIMKMYFGICGYEEHTLKQIAKKLNLSPETVRLNLRRAIIQTKYKYFKKR